LGLDLRRGYETPLQGSGLPRPMLLATLEHRRAKVPRTSPDPNRTLNRSCLQPDRAARRDRIIAILAALLLPALPNRKQSEGMTCANNLKQLSLAWQLYADESADLLVNNHGVPETLALRNTWANNVEDWVDGDDNTNLTYLLDSKLGPFANRATRIYKCPSDREPAANGQRIRSMSMNAMVATPVN